MKHVENVSACRCLPLKPFRTAYSYQGLHNTSFQDNTLLESSASDLHPKSADKLESNTLDPLMNCNHGTQKALILRPILV